MSEAQTFLDGAVAGTLPLSAIDDFVDRWHEGDSTDDLHSFLGMTTEEYSLWLQNPETLALICAARRRRQPLAEAINDNIEQVRTKLVLLETWLRQQGKSA